MKRFFVAGGSVLILLLGCVTPQGSAGTSKEEEKVASTDKLPKVVMRPFSVQGIAPEEVAGVENKFCAEVARCKKVQLVCAEDLKILLQHQQELINFGTCEEQECMAKFANAVAADLIVQSSVSKVGASFVMTTNVVDGKTGAVKKRFSEDVGSGKPEDLLGVAATLAEKVRQSF
jgi:hypothetical protein